MTPGLESGANAAFCAAYGFGKFDAEFGVAGDFKSAVKSIRGRTRGPRGSGGAATAGSGRGANLQPNARVWRSWAPRVQALHSTVRATCCTAPGARRQSPVLECLTCCPAHVLHPNGTTGDPASRPLAGGAVGTPAASRYASTAKSCSFMSSSSKLSPCGAVIVSFTSVESPI